MKRPQLASLALPLLLASGASFAQGIAVRVAPPHKAQFLRFQGFDMRVEAAAADPNGTVEALRVTVDGVDVTSRGVLDSGPSGKTKNWTFRGASLGITGPRIVAATATGTLAGAAISGSGSSTITVRAWDASQTIRAVREHDSFADVGPLARREGHERFGPEASSPEIASFEELHLGAIHSAFHRPAPLDGTPRHKAKNVILFIGDGMGAAHRTGGRVLSKGYTQGKANGTMAIDRFPFNGLLMTSSLNSLITDSAPGAHNYSTGNKTNNGMEGVFPDNTADEADNPRIENLSQFINRSFGKVTGVVSDAFLTDATPSAFLAHTSNRGNGTLVASQFFDERNATALKVLLGGGSYHFIPKSTTGSRRTDERNVINDFKGAGYTYVDTRTALNGYTPGADARLLGLFNLDNMNVAFDKLKKGDPSVVSAFPDQPFLKEMTGKAIDVLKQYPHGFFLMVEGAHIDKQAHRMDPERSLYDVIQLDQAVQVALDFAIATNSDDDPENDTLVLVSADHECSGMALPAVSRPEKAGTRDFAKTYNYSPDASKGEARNDSRVLNFTDYVDADGDGYPDNPDPAHKLIVNFGAASDHYEDFHSNARPRNASSAEGSGFDPGITQNGTAVANPNDPKKGSAGALLVTGVLENGSAGGDAETQAVHTMTDIPISAYGPGSSQFARVTDNTEAFFEIVNAMLGTYPIPTLY